MQFTSVQDINAPLEHVFEQISDFDSYEAYAMRIGATVERRDQLVQKQAGMCWHFRGELRGKDREIDIELPTAESGAEPKTQPDELIVNVEKDGSIVIDGRTLVFDELVLELKSVATHNADTPITIRGHRQAQHQAIVQVMDACGVAGLSNLAVGTTAKEG